MTGHAGDLGTRRKDTPGRAGGMTLTMQEQVGALIAQWAAEGRVAGGDAAAKLEWAHERADLSRAQAIYVLQQRVRSEEALLMFEEKSGTPQSGWLADYADWYWARIEEAQVWAREQITVRRGMIETLRDLK